LGPTRQDIARLDKPDRAHYVALMLDPKIIDDLSRRLADSLPAGVTALQDDVRRNTRAALQAALARLDLVTREEFDIQQAVLARAREKLELLEARISALEAAARKRPG
jgi:BMFP domain-containing protein YqiC